MIRDNRSRPTSSVPRKNSQLPPSTQAGGCRKFSRNCSIGLCGARKLAKIAVRKRSTMTIRPSLAPLLARMDSHTSLAGEGGAARFCAGTATVAGISVTRVSLSSAVANARVQQAIEKIDKEIHAHDQRGDQQHAALQSRIVAAADRFDQPFADARPGKDGFSKDGAAH